MTDSGGIPDETSETLAVGTRLGKYQIVRLLGSGGMGAVYEGRHTEIGKRVAIKVLGPSIAAIPGARARFLREAQLTSKVRHPNIVDVTDMGNEGGQAYLVMEFLEGEDLSQRLARVGPIAPVDLAEVMVPVCSAVVAAHQAGITHRDLKPQNIFLAAGPHGVQSKVLDFGISKGTDQLGAGTLTGTGAMIGTPFYLAPEQILDGKSAGPASDQYALGVILYECLSGRRPFESDNLFVVFQAIVNGSPIPPRQIVPTLPVALEQVVLRAMNVDPKRRYPSVKALGRALLPFVSARGRLLWSEAFGGVEEDEAAADAPVAGRVGATAMMPAVDPQSGISTAKVANRDSGGQDRRGSVEDEAPVPPGTATLDVVSPRRYDARIKKFAAIGGGLAVAILVGVIVSSGGKEKVDQAGPTPPGRTASAGPVGSLATAGKVPVGKGPAGIAAGAGTVAATDTDRAGAVNGASAAVLPREPGQPTTAEPPAGAGTERGHGSSPSDSPAVPTQPPVAGPEEPEPFVVAVTTVPAKAELELDGERVGRGRLRRSLPADHEKHVLRVSADGFEPRVLEFTDRPPPSKIVLVALPRADEETVPDEPSLIAPSPRRPPARRPVEPAPSDTVNMNPNGAPVID
jgi:serine/threonine-protein kinase